MRILSQDGMMDCPYEKTGLSIGWRGDKKEYYIYWHGIYQNDRGKIATYSSLEKAQRAMEMLREKYLETSRGCSEYAYTEFELPRVFQFPTDEEVEGKFET